MGSGMSERIESSRIRLRPITGNEPDSDQLLEAIDQVLMAAYGVTSRRDRLRRFLLVEPGGWVVAEDDGVVVATGGCIAYPDAGFGWIGLIGTAPMAERRGLGRLVTQWIVDYLATKGCASVLDGSAAGAPLYARMGFEDVGVSRLLEARATMLPLQSPAHPHSVGVTPAAINDLPAIAEYDNSRFGADRSRLLHAMFDLYPNRSVVVRRDGDVLGYGIAQDDAIGPVVADSEEACRDVLSALLNLSWNTPPKLVLPPESNYAQLLSDLGFVELRALRRQQFGRTGPLPGLRHTLAAQSSFGEG
jgi:GNAT superfamily N-acetyltransferase